MSLIAAMQDVTITKVIDGVKGSDIADKAKPIGKGKEYLSGGEMGAWRSHVDAFKWIVDQRIGTALILEDDVDWYVLFWELEAMNFLTWLDAGIFILRKNSTCSL